MAMKMKMKSSMKMKVMKKSMKKKASVAKGFKTTAGANRAVFEGRKSKTAGGNTKSDLMKNKRGKIVSKKKSAQGKKAYKYIKAWNMAVQKAKKALGMKGMVLVGKGAKGAALKKKAKSMMK